MKLLFKQRLFSWFDSYDIYAEDGSTVYVVKGQLAWGHCLKLFDPSGRELAVVRERVLSLLPRFEVYEGERLLGSIRRALSLFKPRYDIDYNGWAVEGDLFGWDYTVTAPHGGLVATVSKELLHLTDTYVLDIVRPGDALHVLALVLAIDAEKCSQGIAGAVLDNI